MPADTTLPEATAHHGDGRAPYPCSTWQAKPGAAFTIDYGYCRHSLDVLYGMNDPRCPAACPHKAPRTTAEHFDKLFVWRGAQAAADWARAQQRQRVGGASA